MEYFFETFSSAMNDVVDGAVARKQWTRKSDQVTQIMLGEEHLPRYKSASSYIVSGPSFTGKGSHNLP